LNIDQLFCPLSVEHGPAMKNRFMLAPMTNQQSHEDGTITDDEIHWLKVRAEGGFGMIATCATHVHENGKGFPGQLGIFSDVHIEGLARLATALRSASSLSCVQLYHGGMRAVPKLINGQLISPSDDSKTGARAMSAVEIEDTINHFVAAAVRAEKAGFDGVQLHGAHGYLISAFLSKEFNRREDDFGGSVGNRSRFLFEIVRRIRQRCRHDFQLGVRLSPERFGQDLPDVIQVAQRLLSEGNIDYLDMSLWDAFKEPEDDKLKGRTLMSYFTELERGRTRLGVAGKLIRPSDVVRCIESGADYVSLGKVAVLYHDYPRKMERDPEFEPDWLPVTASYLREQGLGETFIAFLATWTNFVSDYEVPADAVRFDIGEYLKK